jgi:hypothetical protein
MARCLHCNREFTPAKAGHMYRGPEHRHLGPRHPENSAPPDPKVIDRLLDPTRDELGLIAADEWHPLRDPSWKGARCGRFPGR